MADECSTFHPATLPTTAIDTIAQSLNAHDLFTLQLVSKLYFTLFRSDSVWLSAYSSVLSPAILTMCQQNRIPVWVACVLVKRMLRHSFKYQAVQDMCSRRNAWRGSVTDASIEFRDTHFKYSFQDTFTNDYGEQFVVRTTCSGKWRFEVCNLVETNASSWTWHSTEGARKALKISVNAMVGETGTYESGYPEDSSRSFAGKTSTLAVILNENNLILCKQQSPPDWRWPDGVFAQ